MLRRFSLLGALAFASWALAPSTPAEARRGPCLVGIPSGKCHVWIGRVRKVSDGDTIDVDLRGDRTRAAQRIRLSGVQAMEQSVYAKRHRRGDCHATEATERLEALVARGPASSA